MGLETLSVEAFLIVEVKDSGMTERTWVLVLHIGGFFFLLWTRTYNCWSEDVSSLARVLWSDLYMASFSFYYVECPVVLVNFLAMYLLVWENGRCICSDSSASNHFMLDEEILWNAAVFDWIQWGYRPWTVGVRRVFFQCVQVLWKFQTKVSFHPWNVCAGIRGWKNTYLNWFNQVWWYVYHEKVKKWDSTTWFRIWQFQTPP